MTGNPISKNIWQRWEENSAGRFVEWLSNEQRPKGVRSPHCWIIVAMMIVLAFVYYVDQTPMASLTPFNHSFFTGVHDLHRTLFFIPIIYAALLFGMWGSLIASFAFLCVVIPRALLFSPYTDPLIRSVLFVIFAAFIGVLVAMQLIRIESERKARAELDKAYIAGLLDVESSLLIYKLSNRRSYLLEVVYRKTNKYPLQYLANIFGGNVKRQPPGSSNKQEFWQWKVVSAKAYRLIKSIYPLLHIKKRRAELCMEFFELYWQGHSTKPVSPERQAIGSKYVALLKELHTKSMPHKRKG